MKILVLATRSPFPPKDGGQISLYNAVKHLSLLGNEITISYPLLESDHEILIDNHLKIKCYPYPMVVRDRVFNLFVNLFQKIPFKMAKYRSRKFLKFLVDLVAKENFDIILIQHCHMFFYGKQLKKKFNIPIVLREDNIEFSLLEQFSQFKKGIIKYLLKWQMKKTKKYEINSWEYSDKVIFITNNDCLLAKKLAPKMNGTSIYVGQDIPNEQYCLKNNDKFTLVYFATFNWIPNSVSLDWFIREVWMPVFKEIPGAQFNIIGGGDSCFFEHSKLNKNKLEKFNIHFHGFVQNINSTIPKNTLFILPTIMGSGIRMKLLHGLSLGMPILTTDIDFRSLPGLVDKENILYASDADDFKQKIIWSAKNKEELKRIGDNARHLIYEKYNWSSFGVEINNCLSSVCKQ